ncbi:MAG TPA: hypothetical protein VKI41_01710 [Vicinamibacteria bacterium]|nr:hypothetical protein [Vicinamibacteria bacterium]
MAMVGHKTGSIYRRYAIVDEALLREGALKLATYHDTAHEDALASARVVTIGGKAAGDR